MNWDNLIERAAKEEGRIVPKVNDDSARLDLEQYLWKFHGDIEKIDKENVKGKGGWVLPDEGGHVLKSFLDYFSSHTIFKSILTVIIVGYSENSNDAAVVEMIRSLEKDPPKPTYRLGLQLKHLADPNYIVGPSDYLLPKILD